MENNDDDVPDFMILDDEGSEDRIKVKKTKRISAKRVKRRYEKSEDDMGLEADFEEPEKPEIASPKLQVSSSNPPIKKVRIHKNIIPNEAAQILNSYVSPTKSHASIEEVYDKRWSAPLPPPIVSDPMIIEEDKSQQQQPKPKSFSSKFNKATRLLDNDPPAPFQHQQQSTNESPTIMDPRLLDAKQRTIADNLSKMLDEAGAKQLLAVKSTMLDANSEATHFIRGLINKYQDIAQSKMAHILHDDYKPTTTSHNYPLPKIPQYSRAQIVPQLRAAVPSLDERQCKLENNCEGIKVFLQYQMDTADNNQSGPQFPKRTPPFRLKEFMTPERQAHIDSERARGVSMAEILKNIPREPCFLCICMITNELAIQFAQNPHEVQEPAIVQTFQVIFNKPGEYAPNAQLLCGQNFHGIIEPYLQYSRAHYVPFLHHLPALQDSEKHVFGWAEINDIICGPSEAAAPRGDPLFNFVPPPGLSVPASSSFPKAKHSWRSRHFQNKMREDVIFGVQVNRFTNDTHQTGSSTATPETTRPLSTAEEEHKSRKPLFKRYEWLIGNSTFTEPIKPIIRATAPLTGTGTCQLPTTVEVLSAYFDDPISNLVFTNHLQLGTQEQMNNLSDFAQSMYYYDPKKPSDPLVKRACSKVRHDTFYTSIYKTPIHWRMSKESLKPEWRTSPLLKWISVRLNWAIDKQQYIKQLYRDLMTGVNIGVWINNGAYQKSTPIHEHETHIRKTDMATDDKKKTTRWDENASEESEGESDDEIDSTPSLLNEDNVSSQRKITSFSLTGHPKNNVALATPIEALKSLPSLVMKNGFVVLGLSSPSMPNTNIRPTHFPVQTDQYNDLLSDGYNQPSITCLQKFTTPAIQTAKQAELFTHHRYWALYYIKLLDRFIQAHMPICRALSINDISFKSHLKPRTEEENQVELQRTRFHVPTVFQPFDEAYAKWNWTPLQGHQGSYTILKGLYPGEFIFHHTLYELYECMVKKYKNKSLTPSEEFLTTSIQEKANEIFSNWSVNPLLPLSLMDNEQWMPPLPFSKGNFFLWTFLVIVGRLEQLKAELPGIRFDFESDPSSNKGTGNHQTPEPYHLSPAEQKVRRDIEVDFHLHQLQVRLTGYITTARWMLTQLLIEHPETVTPEFLNNPKNNNITAFNDTSIPESVVFFPYEDVDFDGELDMPEFSSLLQKLNFWHRSSNESQSNPILASIQKGIPFRSHGRVLSDHFLKVMIFQDPQFMNLAMLFIICSTLGLYRRISSSAPEMFRPSFAGMAKIDFALLQTPKQLFNFIHVTKSKLIIYMSREILVHEVAKSPHFRKCQVLDWPQLESNTWNVQNLMRRHLEYSKFWLRAPHNSSRRQLETQIDNLYEKNYDILLYQLQDFPHKVLKFFYNTHIEHLDKIITLNVQRERWRRQLEITLALIQEKRKKEEQEATTAAATPKTLNAFKDNSNDTSNNDDAMDIDEPPPTPSLPFLLAEAVPRTRLTLEQDAIVLRDLLENSKIELAMINYELPEQVRSLIWQSLLGIRHDIDIWTVIRQWLSDDDLLLFHRLHNEYTNYSSKSKFENIIHQFSIPSFTMIYFLLQVQTTLSRVKLVAIPENMAQDIHTAMRIKRHRVFDTQPIMSSVYNVYLSFCCNSILTLGNSNSFGNSRLTYNRELQYFSCCQKKTKKNKEDKEGDMDDEEDFFDEDDADEEDEENRVTSKKISKKDQEKAKNVSNAIMNLQTGKAGSIDQYPEMMGKIRKKIARRFDNDSRPLRCQSNPPVLTLNLQGFRLYFGSEEPHTTVHQHCPRCGDFHAFSDKNFQSGRGYMCPNCIQKTWQPSFALQRQMFCAYCGRQHFKDVEHGLESIMLLDVLDLQEPIKLLHLCHNDMPKHDGDFFYAPEILKESEDDNSQQSPKQKEQPPIQKGKNKLVFIDTYFKRHHNMVRMPTMAQFPFQNTVEQNRQGVELKDNGFSWIRYGQKINLIPQAIDSWWPKSKIHPIQVKSVKKAKV